MAIAEKQMGGGLMDLLPLLLGEKTKTGGTSTTTSTANTAPLQQVFKGAQPLDAASYEAMIAAAFAEAAKQIPELTTALANATGSRSSSNSALALGINDANRRAADAAVTQRLQYNQGQQQIAGNAAKGIADSTRGQTSTTSGTQKQGTATNPLIPLIGGFALNQFDKRGGMDAIGRMGSGVMDSIGSFFNPSSDIAMNVGSEWDMAPSGGGGFDMSGFGGGGTNFTAGDSGFDWGSAASGVSDFASGIGDTIGGWADTAGDWLGDAFSDVGSFFGFANGGMPGSYGAGGYGPPCGPQMRGTAPLARGWDGFYASGMQNPSHAPVMRAWNPTPRSGGYADGGMPGQGSGMLRARAAAPMAVADRASMGGDPNQMMQMILQQAMMPQQQQAPEPGIINFLRYLLPTSGFNIHQYANGGSVGPRGYADGGVVRNRNNMGAAPTRQGTGAVTVNSSGGRPNPNSGAGGNGVGSEALTQMVKEMVGLMDTGRTAGLGGNGVVRGGPDTAGGAINSAAGNPLGSSVAEGFVGSLAGMTVPGIFGQLSQVANPAIGAITGMPMGPMSLVKAMLQAARNENQATGDIATAPDPLGAFVGALNAVNPSLGINTSDIGMTNAVSAANAASAVTGTDGISALIGVTDNFAASGGSNSGGALSGAPNTGSAGFGEGADGDAAGLNGESSSFASGGYGESDSAESNYGGGGRSSGGGGGYGGFGGGTGGMGDANGGLLKGPGTGTSDSIPAKSRVPGEHSTRFSNGEFIMPRDAVEFYGPQFFQDLLMKAHAPVRR